MNNKRIISICLLIAAALLFLNYVKNKSDYRQKMVLAHEMHNVLNHLMVDLYNARKDSIKDVPADGRWYDKIAFEDFRHGALQYTLSAEHLWRVSAGQRVLIADHISHLRIRHKPQTPDIWEVQIEAKQNVSLVSNFKIRIAH